MAAAGAPLVPAAQHVWSQVADRDFDGCVFVSHTGRDDVGRNLAPALWRELKDDRRVFFDERSIAHGDSISDTLVRAISRCDVFLALVTPSYCQAKWPMKELLLARAHGRSVFVAVTDTTVDKVKAWVRSPDAEATWDKEGLDAECVREAVLALFERKVLPVGRGDLKAGWIAAATTVALELGKAYPSAGVSAAALAVNPMGAAGCLVNELRQLKELLPAGGPNKLVCQDMLDTAVSRTPVLCKLLAYGRLFREDGFRLNEALQHCLERAVQAVLQARLVLEEFMFAESMHGTATVTDAEPTQDEYMFGFVKKWWKSKGRLAVEAAMEASAKERIAEYHKRMEGYREQIDEYRKQLHYRFDDVDSYVGLATLERVREGAALVAMGVREVEELRVQLQALTGGGGGREDRERALAVVAARGERRQAKGQRVQVDKEPVHSVSVSPNGRVFATGAESGAVVLWDMATGRRNRALEGHNDSVRSVSWSPNGSMLASASSDTTVALCDAVTGQRTRVLEEHAGTVAWSPDGSKVATGSLDDTAALLDVASGQRLHVLKKHSDVVWSVAWSPDGSTLATGSLDKTVMLWDAVSGQHMRTLEGHKNGFRSVAWSPDSAQLASASRDGTVGVWDVSSGQRVRLMDGHSDWVNCVAWSPDGSILASGGSRDKTTRLWDVAGGQCVRVLQGQSDVLSVAWTPDGRCVLTGCWDGTVCIYEVGELDT